MSTEGTFVPWLFVLDIVTMSLFARFVSYFFYRMKVPRVVGDIVSGCLLGPTVLGSVSDTVFPAANQPMIQIFGYIGLMLSSLTAGANFDRRVLRDREWKVLVFSFVNIAIPFGLAFVLYQIIPSTTDWTPSTAAPISTMLFFAAAQAGTSLPLTFLILDELNRKDDLAKFAIGTSTVSTVFLFTTVSAASAQAQAAYYPFYDGLIAFRIGVLIVIFAMLALMQWVWKWGIENNADNPRSWFRRTTTDMNMLIISLCFCVGVGCERLGYTFILGAFITGAFLPFDENIRFDPPKHVKWLARNVMLPMFFLTIGLEFNLRTVTSDSAGYIILFLVWGFASKFVMVLIARALGFNWRDSAFMTSIANTRGFNTLVVANTALAAGQFGSSLFVASVLLSVVSSASAGPLCRCFSPPELSQPSHAHHDGSAHATSENSQHLPDSIAGLIHQPPQGQDAERQPGEPPLLVPRPFLREAPASASDGVVVVVMDNEEQQNARVISGQAAISFLRDHEEILEREMSRPRSDSQRNVRFDSQHNVRFDSQHNVELGENRSHSESRTSPAISVADPPQPSTPLNPSPLNAPDHSSSSRPPSISIDSPPEFPVSDRL